MTWASPKTVRDKVARRWESGSLLRGHAGGEPLEPIRVKLAGPGAGEVADRFDDARAWIARMEAGSRGGVCYQLEWRNIGGRGFGRERIPGHAVVTSYDQAWVLLGVTDEVRRFDDILAIVEDVPAAREWVVRHPLRALETGDEWPRLLAAYAWLDDNRGSGRYLREVSAPGVDTKFAEQHRGMLAALLGVRGGAAGFLDDLGLRRKPDLIRLRPASGLVLPGVGEVAVRQEELACLELAPRSALIVENEITYLSVPVPDEGVVLWGRGFDVHQVGRLPWLGDVDVVYWGDLDTHGFVILDRLRGWLPQVRSVLMDRATLLEHRPRWVREESPSSVALGRLLAEEGELYRELVEDRLGPRVRLEQELVDWSWALERLPGLCS
jgi:putative cytoplasmic protein